MSSVSPAAILFDVNGITLPVNNNTAIAASTPAILFAGSDGTNAHYALANIVHGGLGSVQNSNSYTVQSNATLTTSGSTIITGNYFGCQEIALIVNVTVAPTGTTPSITFTVQDVDPGNGTTVYGNSASTSAITGTGVFTAVLNVTTSSAIKVSWTVSGTTPSFTGLYATITTKGTPSTQTVNGTVTATNASVGTDGAAALTSDTQVGGVTTTNAPTYTTGNLDALSLTTKGGLRIDGVFPTGAAVPISDAMYVGGAVTTSAPSYTTGQMNALSLDTSGNLRVTAITNKAGTSAVTSVAGSTSNTVILASNANRLFATIYNATNKTMYVKLGTTASTSSYSVQLFASSYWEVPSDYTGEIDAVWANGVSGNALVTELTA